MFYDTHKVNFPIDNDFGVFIHFSIKLILFFGVTQKWITVNTWNFHQMYLY